MKLFPYYYLVCGLPELERSDFKAEKEMESVQEWIHENLTADDRKLFRFLIYRNDNKNLLYLMRKREKQTVSEIMSFHRPSVYSYQELEEGLEGLRELPHYMSRFLEEQRTILAQMSGRPRENRLITLYYNSAFELDSYFIRRYFAYKRDLKNIISALNARKFGFSLNDVLIGDYELVYRIRQSSGQDFGLSSTYPYMGELLELIEIKDFKRLELTVDRILRNYIDEITSKDPFDVSNILGYFIKLSLGNRWLDMDSKRGMEKFDVVLNNIISSGEWPSGYSKNRMEIGGD